MLWLFSIKSLTCLASPALPYLHFLACLAPMASFDQAFKATQQKVASRQSCHKLIADPLVSTKQFEKALNAFVTFKGSTDLWALLCPPPGAPLRFDWKSKPSGEWILKCGNLLWDILGIAPNTKVLSTKVTSALRAMAALTPPTLTCHRFHKDLDDTIDKVDVTLRILLAMTRTLRINADSICNRTIRGLSGEHGKKLTLLLGRVELPEDMLLGKVWYDVEEEYGPEGMNSAVTTGLIPLGDLLPAEPAGLPAAPTLALALLPGDQPKSRLDPPPDWGQILSKNIKDEAEPAAKFRRSLQFSEKSLLEAADVFRTKNTSQKDVKKKGKKNSRHEEEGQEGQQEGSKKKVKKPISKKKCKRKVKNVKKIKQASPIVSKDKLIRSGSGLGDGKCSSGPAALAWKVQHWLQDCCHELRVMKSRTGYGFCRRNSNIS